MRDSIAAMSGRESSSAMARVKLVMLFSFSNIWQAKRIVARPVGTEDSIEPVVASGKMKSRKCCAKTQLTRLKFGEGATNR